MIDQFNSTARSNPSMPDETAGNKPASARDASSLDGQTAASTRWKLTVGPSSAVRILSLLAISALALYLREFDITARPFHSDEGVNFGFLNTMKQKGYYPYSHENYHGPLFFYLCNFYSRWYGTSELALRGWPITAGVLTILCLLLVRRGSGSLFLPLAALLIAVSPTMIFQSRYFIHESTLVLGTAIFAFALFDWLMTSRPRDIYVGAFGIAIMIATKETWIITVAALGAATICTRTPRFVLTKLWEQRNHVAGGYLLALVFNIITYTGGFVWTEGLREAVLAIPQWFGRGVQKDVGHFKSFSYYVWTVFGTVEPQLLAAFALAIVTAIGVAVLFPPRRLRRELAAENALVRFTGVWTIVITVLYSSVPYKTPWLIINMSLPALLFLAAGVDWLARRRTSAVRYTAYGLAAALPLSMLPYAVVYNYTHMPLVGSALENSHPYGVANPQSYVHTTEGMLALTDFTTRYMRENPSSRLLVAVNGYWPLPYYLRDFSSRMAYLNTSDGERWKREYDVLLMEKDVTWRDPDYMMIELRLSEVEETKAFFRIQGSASLPRCFTVNSLERLLGVAPAVCG